MRPARRMVFCRLPRGGGEFRRPRARGVLPPAGGREFRCLWALEESPRLSGARGISPPAGGEETTDTISSLSLRKRRNGFALPKKRKGLVGNACPKNSQSELSAQCAGSAGARFPELADACYEHCSNERPAGVGSRRGIVRFSHNVRGRHHARRNVVPPGRRHIAVSVQRWKTA